jgi:hypothetical protein
MPRTKSAPKPPPIRNPQWQEIADLAVQLAKERRFEDDVSVTEFGGRSPARVQGAIRDFFRRHQIAPNFRLKTYRTAPEPGSPLGTVRLYLAPIRVAGAK